MKNSLVALWWMVKARTRQRNYARGPFLLPLLEARVDVHAVDEDGHSALLLAAAQRGSGNSVRALLAAGANVNDCDGHGAPALLWVAGYGGDVDVASALLDALSGMDQGLGLDDAETPSFATARFLQRLKETREERPKSATLGRQR